MIVLVAGLREEKALDEFRESIKPTDSRVRAINDYLSASDVFPGVGPKGGCATSSGIVTTLDSARSPPTSRIADDRPLPLFARNQARMSLIRLNEALSILRKVIAVRDRAEHSLSTAGEQALRKAGHALVSPF